MVSEDTIDKDDQKKELQLSCNAKVAGQDSKVGSYVKFVPRASTSQTPDVIVLYPEVIKNSTGHNVRKDTVVCISNRLCKVVAIFGGL